MANTLQEKFFKHRWKTTLSPMVDECINCKCLRRRQLRPKLMVSYQTAANDQSCHAPPCSGPPTDTISKAFIARMKKRFKPLRFVRRNMHVTPSWYFIGIKYLGMVSIRGSTVVIERLDEKSSATLYCATLNRNGIPEETMVNLADPQSLDKIDGEINRIITRRIEELETETNLLRSAIVKIKN